MREASDQGEGFKGQLGHHMAIESGKNGFDIFTSQLELMRDSQSVKHSKKSCECEANSHHTLHLHLLTHAHAHAHVHTHTHAHVHTHTHAQWEREFKLVINVSVLTIVRSRLALFNISSLRSAARES